MIFFIYQFLLSIIILFSPFIIIFRILKNKEDKYRFKEKFCFISKKRRTGKLIWFHGSSVGEILSAVPIIKRYDTYMKTTKPVLDFYSNNPNFYEIDGSSKIDEITAKIDNFLTV